MADSEDKEKPRVTRRRGLKDEEPKPPADMSPKANIPGIQTPSGENTDLLNTSREADLEQENVEGDMKKDESSENRKEKENPPKPKVAAVEIDKKQEPKPIKPGSKTDAARIKSLNTQIKRLNTEKEALTAQGDKYWALLNEKNTELNIVTSENEENKTKLERTLKERDDLQTQLNEANQDNDVMKDRISDLGQALADANEKIEHLES